ncbi:glycerol transporter, partial [Cryomyces antarcticus]
MLWLHYLKRLYSLDTLDTRFTTSSRTPQAPIDPARASSGEVGPTVSRQNGRSAASGAQPSRWATPEFYFYYLIFLVCVPLMFKAVYDVSK